MKITINGIEFVPAEITFNTLCDMEEAGAPTDAWDKLDMSILRAYLAACLGVKASVAGEMLGAHIVGGGRLDELREAFIRATKESDFFAALQSRSAAASEQA